MNNHSDIKIGDVFLIRFDGNRSEQRGLRPGIIFQNNVGNQYSPNVVALPLTSSVKRTELPTHVFLPAAETGLLRDSVVLCENPRTVSKEELGNYLTTIPSKYIGQIAVANLLASSAISYVEPNTLLAAWQKALVLNKKP